MQAIELPFAEAHALGFIRTDVDMPLLQLRRGEVVLEQTRKLVPVARFHFADELFPSVLPASMVVGAVLDRARVKEALAGGSSHTAYLTKEQLYLFLTTRNYHDLSDKAWIDLARMADRQLDLEAKLEELNPDFDGDASEPSDKKYRPLVRDPSGRCLQQYLIATNALSPAQFSQFDSHYVAPSSIGGWVSNLAEIQATAPYLAYEQLGAFLEHAKHADLPFPGAEPVAVRVSRVLLRGHAHVSHLTRLIEFKYHPHPLPEEHDVAAFSMHVRASMKNQVYRVTVLVQVDKTATSVLKPIKNILRAYCEPSNGEQDKACKASGWQHISGDKSFFNPRCTHCSALLHVIALLHRPHNLALEISAVATTECCLWNHPSGDLSVKRYAADVPVSLMTIRKMNYMDVDPVDGVVKMPSNLTGVATDKRSNFNPIPLILQPLNYRDTIQRKERRAELERWLHRDNRRLHPDHVEGPAADVDDDDEALPMDLHVPAEMPQEPDSRSRLSGRAHPLPRATLKRSLSNDSPDPAQFTEEQVIALEDTLPADVRPKWRTSASKVCACGCGLDCTTQTFTVPKAMNEEHLRAMLRVLTTDRPLNAKAFKEVRERLRGNGGQRLSQLHFSERQRKPFSKNGIPCLIDDAMPDVKLSESDIAQHNLLIRAQRVLRRLRQSHSATDQLVSPPQQALLCTAALAEPTAPAASGQLTCPVISDPTSGNSASCSTPVAEDSACLMPIDIAGTLAPASAAHSLRSPIATRNSASQPHRPHAIASSWNANGDSPVRLRNGSGFSAFGTTDNGESRRKRTKLATPSSLPAARSSKDVENARLREENAQLLLALNVKDREISALRVGKASMVAQLQSVTAQLRERDQAAAATFVPLSYETILSSPQFANVEWLRHATGFRSLEALVAFLNCLNSDGLCESVRPSDPPMEQGVSFHAQHNAETSTFYAGSMWRAKQNAPAPTASEGGRLQFREGDIVCVADRQRPPTPGAPGEPVNAQPPEPPAADADSPFIFVCSVISGKVGTVDSRLFERYQPTEASEPEEPVDSGRPSIMTWKTCMLFVLMNMRMGWEVHDAAPLFGVSLRTARR